MPEEENLDQIKVKHENLVNSILTQEERLLSQHKKYLDYNVDVVKRQMTLLNEVDRPGSDVEMYIS